MAQLAAQVSPIGQPGHRAASPGLKRQPFAPLHDAVYFFFFLACLGQGPTFGSREPSVEGGLCPTLTCFPRLLPDSLAKEGCPGGLDQNCWEPHLESEESMFDIFFTFDL